MFCFSVERALMFNGVLLLVLSTLKASNSQAVESASSKLRFFSSQPHAIITVVNSICLN